MNANLNWVGSNSNNALGIRILITLDEGVYITPNMGFGSMNSKLQLLKTE